MDRAHPSAVASTRVLTLSFAAADDGAIKYGLDMRDSNPVSVSLPPSSRSTSRAGNTFFRVSGVLTNGL